MERQKIEVDQFIEIYTNALKSGLCSSQVEFASLIGMDKASVCNILNGKDKYLTQRAYNKWYAAFHKAMLEKYHSQGECYDRRLEEMDEKLKQIDKEAENREDDIKQVSQASQESDTIAQMAATIKSQQDTIAKLIAKYVL